MGGPYSVPHPLDSLLPQVSRHNAFCLTQSDKASCERPQCSGGTHHTLGTSSGPMCVWDGLAEQCSSNPDAGYGVYYGSYGMEPTDEWDCECTDIPGDQCPDPAALGCKLEVMWNGAIVADPYTATSPDWFACVCDLMSPSPPPPTPPPPNPPCVLASKGRLARSRRRRPSATR